MPSVTGYITIALSSVLIVPVLLFAGLSNGSGCVPTPTTTPNPSPSHVPGSLERPASLRSPTASPTASITWDSGQLANAATIIHTGNSLGVPERGWIIALAVAIQESSLRNLDHGDLAGPDSRGLFQQRSTWGPESTRMNPAGAATLFYQGGDAGQSGLLDIPDWQNKPLTQVAQAVERSGHPQAYANHEADATSLVNRLAPDAVEATPFSCLSAVVTGLPLGDGGSVPAGYTIPPGTSPAAATAITWALEQLGTPYSYGGDCTAAHSGDPSRECDCSSLTQQAYRAAGVDLPRTTTEQVNSGTAVATAQELRPGDLIFIPGRDGTPSNPAHVGLYIGDGLLVHSPATGRNVQVASVASWMPISRIRRLV